MLALQSKTTYSFPVCEIQNAPSYRGIFIIRLFLLSCLPSHNSTKTGTNDILAIHSPQSRWSGRRIKSKFLRFILYNSLSEVFHKGFLSTKIRKSYSSTIINLTNPHTLECSEERLRKGTKRNNYPNYPNNSNYILLCNMNLLNHLFNKFNLSIKEKYKGHFLLNIIRERSP